MLKLAPYISFTSSGENLFVMNHRSGAELLLNGDASDIIRLLDRNETAPREADAFIDELKKHAIVVSESVVSKRGVGETVEDVHLYEEVKARATEEIVPFSAYLELTRRCPLSCAHCYLRDVPTEQSRELSTDEWISVIDQLHALGSFHISVTGGELFVRDDAIEILTAIRKKRMALSILSSGAGVSADVAQKVASIAPMVWQTSMYGDEKTHDAITKVPGSFKQMLEIARFMKGEGISVRVSAVMTKIALPHLSFIQDLCRNEGFILSFNSTLLPGLGGTPPPEYLALSNAELTTFFDKINVSQPTEKEQSEAPCSAAKSVIAINHCGDVYPCIEWRDSGGNIREDSVGNIWRNSTLFQDIRAAKHLSNSRNALFNCRSRNV